MKEVKKRPEKKGRKDNRERVTGEEGKEERVREA